MQDTITTIPVIEQDLKPGARFMFGKSGTIWRVLNVDTEKMTMLVITETIIDERKYHDKYESVTWEKCTLRKWLNDSFYKSEFTEEEREAIVESEVGNPDNAKYKTKGGSPTKDKVFLLSIDEAEKYFENDQDRATGT